MTRRHFGVCQSVVDRDDRYHAPKQCNNNATHFASRLSIYTSRIDPDRPGTPCLIFLDGRDRSLLKERKDTRSSSHVIEHPFEDIPEIAIGLNARRRVNVFACHLFSRDWRRERDESLMTPTNPWKTCQSFNSWSRKQARTRWLIRAFNPSVYDHLAFIVTRDCYLILTINTRSSY